MNNLTTAQKVYLAALLAAAGAWIGLQIGIPVYEYNHGKSPLTALLAHLSDVSLLAGFGIIAIGFVLQSVGVLPTACARAAADFLFWLAHCSDGKPAQFGTLGCHSAASGFPLQFISGEPS